MRPRFQSTGAMIRRPRAGLPCGHSRRESPGHQATEARPRGRARRPAARPSSWRKLGLVHPATSREVSRSARHTRAQFASLALVGRWLWPCRRSPQPWPAAARNKRPRRCPTRDRARIDGPRTEERPTGRLPPSAARAHRRPGSAARREDSRPCRAPFPRHQARERGRSGG